MLRYRHAFMVVSLFMLVFGFSVASFAADKFPVGYDKSIDLTNTPVQADVDGYTVKVDMARPAKPFRDTVIKLKIYSGDEPAAVSDGYMLFNMSMDMGLFKAPLKKEGNGYIATVKLPKCLFGGTRWFGKLIFKAAGAEHQKTFIFDMKE